jgi:ABC-type antimicrobial peptide transport system permease subunit
VVRDFELYMSPDPDLVDPPVFFTSRDSINSQWSLAVRPTGRDLALIQALRVRLRDVMPPRAFVSVQRWLQNYDYSFRAQSFFVTVFGTLGFAALLLGALGLFSVLSYVVSQRTREFAVRTSLGATPGNLMLHVMKSAFELAIGGTAIGALLSFWASAGLSGMLFGVKNTDPVALVAAELILLAVTMAASLAPAIRASRADPIEVIRAA